MTRSGISSLRLLVVGVATALAVATPTTLRAGPGGPQSGGDHGSPAVTVTLFQSVWILLPTDGGAAFEDARTQGEIGSDNGFHAEPGDAHSVGRG